MDQQPYGAFRPNPPAQDAPDRAHLGTAAPAQPSGEAITAAAAQLRGRAFLYDDPDAYMAGVRDVMSELDERFGARSTPPPAIPGDQ